MPQNDTENSTIHIFYLALPGLVLYRVIVLPLERSNPIKILNIGIIAHVDAGKTTLTENILYLGGTVSKVGRVDKGNTQTDSMAVERRRGISVRAAATSFFRTVQGENIKFNLIDTPGHVDFVSEVERNLAVLDGVVLVISAKEGLQSQTRVLMDTIKAQKMPAVIFVNKIDRLGADIDAVVKEANEYMGGRLVPTARVNDENKVIHYIDAELMEATADTVYSHSDHLLTKFANNEDITEQEFIESLTSLTRSGQLYPVFFGSALYGIGVENLLDVLPRYLPAATQNTDAPLSAVVFKVDNSGPMRLVYLRLYSGALHLRKTMQVGERAFKLTKLFGLENGKITLRDKVDAGDIAVLPFGGIKVGSIFGEAPANFATPRLGRPTLNVEIAPVDPAQRRDLYTAVAALADEDPMLGFNAAEAYTVQLFGEIQMEILQEILRERYGIDTEFAASRTVYMETPTQTASAVIPIGQTFYSAGVGFTITPTARGNGITYKSDVTLGVLEKSFQTAVEEAVFTTCQQGIFGWEVTDMHVSFNYSDYDSVNGTPADYRNLVPLVLMQAMAEADVALLEPIMDFELRVPSTNASRALYDLRLMNAAIDGTTALPGDTMVITGQVPADTSRGYGAKVGSYTGGSGLFLTKFAGQSVAVFTEDKVNATRVNPAANTALYMMQKLGAR